MKLRGKTLWPGISILSMLLLMLTFLQADAILYSEIHRTIYCYFNDFPDYFPAFSV